MAGKLILLVFWLILPISWAYPETLVVPVPQTSTLEGIEPFKDTDRVLILAPHPDDESIGCAGIIQEALKKGANVHVLYLTNGDHNQFAFIVYEKRLTLRKNEFIHMGEVRRLEAINAMRLLGLNESRLIFMGYPDFGTFTMFKDYWKSPRPYKSMLTRINKVPYKENFSYNMAYNPQNILDDLEKILVRLRPTKIFVSHPADVNVDHKSFYLYLEIALADLENILPAPKIYPYLIHWQGWPLPRHYHPELGILPPRQLNETAIRWQSYNLTDQQVEKKYRAILSYRSQTHSSAFYLLAFARKNELFGGYPEIELATVPATSKGADNTFKRLLAISGLTKISPQQKSAVPKNIPVKSGAMEKASYQLEDGFLSIRLKKAKDHKQRLISTFYLFGYNHKMPFAQMPKIFIVTKYDQIRVFDGKKMISSDGLKIEVGSEEYVLKVPLKVLGDPDFVFSLIKAYIDKTPFYLQGFTKVRIR